MGSGGCPFHRDSGGEKGGDGQERARFAGNGEGDYRAKERTADPEHGGNGRGIRQVDPAECGQRPPEERSSVEPPQPILSKALRRQPEEADLRHSLQAGPGISLTFPNRPLAPSLART